MVFVGGGLAGDDALRKHYLGIAAQPKARESQQGVLAGAARAGNDDDPARPDRRRAGCVGAHHTTRRAMRHTERTTGTFSVRRMRTRSARLPTAISPRSLRPTASAGVLVTVRRAAGRSIAGTACGRIRAAINRLAGT